MYPSMFAIGRLPGWIAQWKEMIDGNSRIGRPRQIYVGDELLDYVPIPAREYVYEKRRKKEEKK